MSSPLAPKFKTEWLVLTLLVLSFGLSFYFYQNFPDQVPSHWNIQGEVDGYSKRGLAAFLMPLLALGMYVMFLVLPYLDPKKDQYSKFRAAYHGFKNLIIAFLFILYLLTGINGLGHPIDIGFFAPLMVGGLLVIIGFFLRRLKTNWFIGIRTPWTMSSEIVWKKTSRLGSGVFMVGGILIAAAVLVPPTVKIIFLALAIFLMALALPLASYFFYYQEMRDSERIKK